jgi:AcrR family transcriptional regulator
MTKKDAILQTATAFFAEKGYKDTSMAELARSTAVAQGTIFYHFKNKEELFRCILEEFRKSIVEEFEAHIKDKAFKTGMDMLEAALAFYLYLAGSMESRFLILHRHDAYELAKVNSVCREHLEAIYNCLVDIFEEPIRLGQKDGSMRETPPRKAALIVFTMVDGLVRFDTYEVYDSGTLYEELLDSCRRMLQNDQYA